MLRMSNLGIVSWLSQLRKHFLPFCLHQPMQFFAIKLKKFCEMIRLEDAKKALHGVKILEQSQNICEIRVKIFVKSELRSAVRQGSVP